MIMVVEVLAKEKVRDRNCFPSQGSESPQNKVRRRIVRFLGSLGGQVNAGLVESDSAAAHVAGAVAWDSKNRLEFALPFQDMKPSLFLGGL